MAKLQKSAAVLAASTLLGFFFFSGPVLAAQAAPSNVVIKTADSIGTIGSSEDDSDEDSPKESKREQKQEQKKLEREAHENESATPLGEKKRKELREKFGNKDSLGLPPIVIHPEDDSDDDEDESSAQIVKPKKKPGTSAISPAPASPTATVDPSITTNTQSLKGGQLATGSASIAGSGAGASQSVSTSGSTKSVTQNQSTKQQAGSANTTQDQVAPIDVKSIDFTGKTPADKFVEAATVSIGAMAAGALALGVVAMLRGKRQQKDLKAEYQYSSTD